tara:strand:- start:16900 stop:20733 length:3834 start_codon:yes stop_codon:yes gene_type:complete
MVLKKYLLLLLVWVNFVSVAQETKLKNFSLDWEMSSELKTSSGQSWVFPLVKNNSVNPDGMPVFLTMWSIGSKSNNVSYSLKNIVYETVDTKYLKSIEVKNISLTIQSSLLVSKSSENNNLTFELLPLVKDGDIVKKIVSFDLEYTLSKSQKKAYSTSVAENSVLSSGRWYKFSVHKTGVFKIDANLLNQIGVSTSGLDPRNIRIYGNGGVMLPALNSDFRHDDLQENSIYVSGEKDGVFNDEDYVLFYAKGPNDWLVANERSISHRKNIYEDEAYYFITVDNGTGARVASSRPIESATTDLVTTYKDYLFKEDDLINLFEIGQQWFGDAFATTRTRTYNFNFDNIDLSKDLFVKVRGVAKSTSNTSMLVSLNNSPLFSLNYNAISRDGFVKADDESNSTFVPVNSSSIQLKVEYNNGGNPSSEAYLDYIEVIGDKLLKASGNQFSFRNFLSQESSKILEYSVENSSNVSMLWDVTDFLHPKIIANQSAGTSNFTFKTTSGNLNEYIVLNSSDYFVPKVLSGTSITNQNLHSLKDIEYLVITKEEFMGQAQRLASHHKINSNLTSKVISLKQIYNEFGSGSKDITAIRDFVKYLYDNATSSDSRIKYLCLFGDSSYDYKDRISGNNNIVPVYLAYKSFSLTTSFVTDDYYGMMGPNEGNMNTSDKQDVATGRILVSDTQQAEDVVDKILNFYKKESLGGWKNTVTLFSDDMENPSEYVIQEDMEKIADLIASKTPQFNIKKIYADSYVQLETAGGGRYPAVNIAVSNAVEKGSLVIDYFGHGGLHGLGHEGFLTIPDIRSWVNFDRSPLFITVTCDFSKFDNPARVTAGEEMVLSKTGGAASLISTTREVFIFYGRSFNDALIREILDFNGNDYTISEALMHTKNNTPSSSKQHFFIFSLGDPAMKLGIPKPNIKVTKINDKDITISKDTIKALSKMKVEGLVTDMSGNTLTNYNGILSTVIYDKPTEKKTLNNDNFVDSGGNPLIMNFEVQESVVFRGNAEVVNGVFEYDFVVPKDIKLSYGKSKISLYADDTNESKGGYDAGVVIGGVNDDAEEDTQGPEIELFMNDNSFIDGGNTSEVPNLIAQFSDANGINTSLGAIGHAITVVLDGDDGNPIQLNEFYESEIGDFTKGNVKYTLRKLEPGSHTLKVKVWDTYNNPSEKSLTFTVTESSTFVLENILNYPNPFVNYTEFWFNHNQPNQVLDVKIYIYTVSGKLVKSIQDIVQTSGSLSRSISWNGKDDFGEKVGKGVYVYKVQVTNTTTGVSAEKFEKLVLLQ